MNVFITLKSDEEPPMDTAISSISGQTQIGEILWDFDIPWYQSSTDMITEFPEEGGEARETGLKFILRDARIRLTAPHMEGLDDAYEYSFDWNEQKRILEKVTNVVVGIRTDKDFFGNYSVDIAFGSDRSGWDRIEEPTHFDTKIQSDIWGYEDDSEEDYYDD